MRVAAPEFGPVALAGLRVVIAAVMLFLDEEITVNMAAGTVIILVGTAMTTGLLSFNRRGAKASSG